MTSLTNGCLAREVRAQVAQSSWTMGNGQSLFTTVVTASQVISKQLTCKEVMLTRQQMGVYLMATFLELR